MNEIEYKGVLHKEVNKLSKINPRFYRILSMLLDHILMCLIVVPMMILAFALVITFEDKLNKEFGIALIFFPFFIYLNKDFFNGKSPAKRILGYQVIDIRTNNPANELQCFVRNLTICIAWPVEVIVSLINPKRRIGDLLANTKVVLAEKEKLKSIWTDLKNKKLKINYLVILIIGGVYFYVLSLFWPNLN